MIEFRRMPGCFVQEKKSPIYDTIVAAWLLDTENEIGLKALSKRYQAHDGGVVGDSEEGEASRDRSTIIDQTSCRLTELAKKYAIDDAVRPFS